MVFYFSQGVNRVKHVPRLEPWAWNHHVLLTFGAAGLGGWQSTGWFVIAETPIRVDGNNPVFTS